MAIVVIVLLLFQIVTQFVWLVEALKIVCPSLSRTSNFDYNSNSCSSYYSNCYGNNRRCKLSLYLLPKDIPFRADQIEILRILGKIDVQIDQFNVEEAKKEIEKYGGDPESVLDSYDSSNSADGRVTSVRIFEARIPGGSPCFLKEYLPIGLPFGRRELLTTRKLSSRFNELLKEKQENEDSDSDNSKRNSDDPFAPFPVLLGSLRPDARIEDYEFRKQWKQRFPRVAPPQKGNLWLVFQWDKTTFRTMKRYPPLPQIVEGLDYFNKDMRDKKRWRFVRKIMRKGLESLDYIHRSGFCHNSISSDSLWLTTTNQVEISDLAIKITDLGSAQRLVDLGPYGREGVMEDLYQLGFAFLELVISSFNDDNIGAQIARARLTGEKMGLKRLVAKVEDINYTQLSQKELQQIFETTCDSDFQALREFCRSIEKWKEAVSMLEKDNGAGWKLIFKLLARGRLYDENKEKPLKITGIGLVREYKSLFEDTYV